MLYKTKKTKPSHPPTLVFRATRKGYPISSILTVSFDIDPMKNQSIDMSRKPVGRFLWWWKRLEWVKSFLANVPILYPLKTPENLWLSDVFRGYKMGTLAGNGLCTWKTCKTSHACIYLLKVNLTAMCKICSKVITIKTTERRPLMSILLVFRLLTLNRQIAARSELLNGKGLEIMKTSRKNEFHPNI